MLASDRGCRSTCPHSPAKGLGAAAAQTRVAESSDVTLWSGRVPWRSLARHTRRAPGWPLRPGSLLSRRHLLREQAGQKAWQLIPTVWFFGVLNHHNYFVHPVPSNMMQTGVFEVLRASHSATLMQLTLNPPQRSDTDLPARNNSTICCQYLAEASVRMSVDLSARRSTSARERLCAVTLSTSRSPSMTSPPVSGDA